MTAHPILAIDPSTTLTGWALLDGGAHLLEAGFLRPDKTRDPSMARVSAMIDGLEELIERRQPRAVIVEVPSGKAGTGSRRGASSSLAIYGFGAGRLFEAARELLHYQHAKRHHTDGVFAINERTWTRGYREGNRTLSKAARQQLIAAIYPTYAASTATARDTGGDVADAIGLGRWWILHPDQQGAAA
jgi:hypothetical protein